MNKARDIIIYFDMIIQVLNEEQGINEDKDIGLWVHRPPPVVPRLGDKLRLPFGKGSFDAVVAEPPEYSYSLNLDEDLNEERWQVSVKIDIKVLKDEMEVLPSTVAELDDCLLSNGSDDWNSNRA